MRKFVMWFGSGPTNKSMLQVPGYSEERSGKAQRTVFKNRRQKRLFEKYTLLRIRALNIQKCTYLLSVIENFS